MTIDEALLLLNEKLSCDYNISGCVSCDISSCTEKDLYNQLSEWLELLKWYEQGMEDIPCESGVLPKDVYSAGYSKAIDDIVKNIIYPLLDEYDIGLWEDISYIALAEKWVELVRKHAYDNNGNDLIKEDLCKWIAEQLKSGGKNERF